MSEPYDGPGEDLAPSEVWDETHVSIDHRVIIICDSVLKRRTKFALYVKHGKPPSAVSCPHCGRRARASLEREIPDWDPGPSRVSRMLAHLAYPFRGEYAGE